MQVQQRQESQSKIEKSLSNLTHQLLKDYKIGTVPYIIIKIIEYLQLVYFVMRVESEYHWNLSIASYFSILVNRIVVESNIRLNPGIFIPMLYITTSVLFLIIVFGVLIGTQAGWGVKMPLFVKILVPVLNILLFLFMTVITIPASQLIFICFDKNTSSILKIVEGGQSIIFGTLLSIFFIVINAYTLIFYRQSNPFSNIHHSGRSILKGLFIFLIKVLLGLYSISDIKGSSQTLSNYLFTIIILCLICQNHYQIGLYKPFSRKIQTKLAYFVLILGMLHSLDSLSSENTQKVTFSYLFPLCLLMHLVSDSIQRYLHQSNLLLNVVLNDSPQKFQKHIITLINLIQNMSQRQHRIQLQGYLHIHRRQCRLGSICSCQRLGIIRQRNQQLIKIQYYKLVIVLLTENKRKFPNYYRIDLLLGLVYHFRLKNSLQAIYSFTKLTSDKSNTFLNRLYVKYYLRKVQEQMKQEDEKQVSSTNRINKFFQYTNKMVQFEEHVERCTKDHIQFWRLMLDNNPEIKRLQDLGTLITRNKDYLKEQFDSIFEKNQNSVCLLTIYGKFLLEVTNEQSYNVKYIQKAQSILKNIKESSKIEEAGGKYTENADTCVVIISGNDGQLGRVIHTNNTVKKLLGYRRDELIGRNIAAIMPKIYGDNHNATLTRYIRASESKVNGHERVVPALTKDGFILPTTALTKALPTLAKGIQIVGFLAKMQYKLKDDQQVQSNMSYILYRTDTEEIVGISEGCYEQYHIHTSLIYGNTNNINNQLKIKNLFGISFQKGQEGRVAAALQIGQVEMIINTLSLKDQFIISKVTSNQDIDSLVDQRETEGVQREVIGKNILATVYYGITLKLLAFYPKKVKKGFQKKISRRSNSSYTINQASKKKINNIITKGSKFFEQNSKTQTDDIKNLKDFKNFISIKNQPSAISVLSTICLLFILLICSSIIGLVINWFNIKQINQDMLKSVQLSLYTQLATPQIMTQVQKQILALTAEKNNINNFTSYQQSKNHLLQIIQSTKKWQLNLLPYKYKFNQKYDDQMTYYSLSSIGKLSNTQQFIQQSIFDYISEIETISLTNLSSLSDFQVNLHSNTYQKYASAKVNEIYSIRQALNSSNTVQWNWYKDAISSKNNLLIILCSIMMGGICIWLILLLPYVLSVTRINNRVLSLFSLIPYGEVCKLIYGCLIFMSNNLLEADINIEDLKFYQNEQNQKMIQPQINSPIAMNSPSQMGLLSDISYTQSNILRKSQMVDKVGRDSMLMIEQKFEKMINSEDRNKKMVILKFVGISLLIFGFVLFFLFYSMQVLSSASTNISYYQLIGRRPALMRNTKLLITEYLLNPSYSPLSSDSIKKINLNLISQFYNLQASLLGINLKDLSTSFNDYNNGDICSKIGQFSDYTLLNQSLNAQECYGVGSNILQKGIKTGIVSVLQSIRSIVSQYNSTAPKTIIASYIKMFDSLTKYIETPMLAILNSQNKKLTQAMNISNIMVITSAATFIACLLLCWKIIWGKYLSQLNIKIWRTKGLLNLIPMRIITSNDLLKNQFTSGQLEKAVR